MIPSPLNPRSESGRPQRFSLPSRDQIKENCREIQSGWSLEQREQRIASNRLDPMDQRFHAHLRFMQFLIAHAK